MQFRLEELRPIIGNRKVRFENFIAAPILCVVLNTANVRMV